MCIKKLQHNQLNGVFGVNLILYHFIKCDFPEAGVVQNNSSFAACRFGIPEQSQNLIRF